MEARQVLVELRGRIESDIVLKMVAEACDADFGARKGSTLHVLVSAAAEGKPAKLRGECRDGRPVRLNDILSGTGLQAVVKSAPKGGEMYDEVYFINQKHGVSPELPFTKFGPAVPRYIIGQMKQRNPFFGLDEIERSVAFYDPENYPKFGISRSVLSKHVEMPSLVDRARSVLKAAF